ncbi:MAG: type II secretion system GspH family protein [Chloroflexi bacterium]|nr:type II secretion system GspH family protein [Chloroflexota bacterium]
MKRQGGFALVELLIATAITGVIAGVLGTTVFQIINVSEYGNDRLTALHELQNIAYWVSRDAQMADNATGGDELVLTFPDGSSITYEVTGQQFRRRAGGPPLRLAWNITSANFSVDNRTVTMSLNSSPEGRDNVSQQGTYKVSLRPSGE